MGSKTIGLDEEAYERLKAHKREDESFSDTVKRLSGEVASDWRESFGRYEGEMGAEFERVVVESRDQTGAGLRERQSKVIDAMTDDETSR